MSDLRRREEAVGRLNAHYLQCHACESEYLCATALELRARIPEIARCSMCNQWVATKDGKLPVHALFNLRCDASGRASAQPQQEDPTI